MPSAFDPCEVLRCDLDAFRERFLAERSRDAQLRDPSPNLHKDRFVVRWAPGPDHREHGGGLHLDPTITHQVQLFIHASVHGYRGGCA